MGIDFSNGPIRGRGVIVPATDDPHTPRAFVYEPECDHAATVTTPWWPVIHPNPVSVGDEVVILPPILVTECVTCGERIDPSPPHFTATPTDEENQ